MNADQIKKLVSTDRARFGKSGHAIGGKDFDQTTMFVPVATEGKAVINVTKRQDFLTTGIGTWREYHFFRAVAVSGSILAVFLLFSNPLLSAAVAMIAAWSYGEYLKKDFTVNKLYKTRYLLEST